MVSAIVSAILGDNGFGVRIGDRLGADDQLERPCGNTFGDIRDHVRDVLDAQPGCI